MKVDDVSCHSLDEIAAILQIGVGARQGEQEFGVSCCLAPTRGQGHCLGFLGQVDRLLACLRDERALPVPFIDERGVPIVLLANDGKSPI